MNKQESDILNALYLEPFINQRILAEISGHSLGVVNRSVKELIKEGYLDEDVHLTSNAQHEFNIKAPRKAIILAAGFGMRMVPINLAAPKALLEVNGERLVERQIKQLHAVGIKDICVVVGFMKEKFEYLIDEYGVELVVNQEYATTIKQTILGGYVFGVGSTIVSFVILGNYGLGLQVSGGVDFIMQYAADGDLYGLILSIINTMPVAKIILVITLLCMVAFYATSFDSIAYTASCYSYKHLGENEHPHKLVSLLWCVLLIILPIALVFSESSMNNIQSVSIISAFPIGIIMIIMICGFLKDIEKYTEEEKTRDRRGGTTI